MRTPFALARTRVLFAALAAVALIGTLPAARAQEQPPGGCSGSKPRFDTPDVKPNYSTFTGQVAVVTCLALNPNDPTMVVIDLTNQAGAPIDSNWSSLSVPPTQFYHHPSWTKAMLGDVFGTTLDSNGNIYVAASTCYGTNAIGSLGGGRGGIYRIDTFTALPSVFVGTVNASTYTGGNLIPNTGPGLGNINYDSVHQNFYVSNFEDGLIYRIDAGGNILGTWDHGANLPSAIPASAAIPDDPTSPYTQLGRRVWGVQAYNGRLYYSVWNEDMSRPSATKGNEIWSVGLNAAGGFVGPAKREVVVPSYPSQNWSSPVSDISFGPSGTMLIAERSMYNDQFPSAHQSRLMEYQLSAGVWVPSPNVFKVGAYAAQTNSAGGCDYDYSTGGRVWVTGDALHYNGVNDNIYGIQGTPPTGGDNTNSILIDANEDIISVNKTQIGDVEIPCPKPTVQTSECCGAKPGFRDPAYSGTFTGQVAVATNYVASPTDPVVRVFDLKNQCTAPLNTNYAPPVYQPSNWSKANLGTVFGVTLNNAGDIYVAASSCYSSDFFPGGDAGRMYQISGSTGAIVGFVSLPTGGPMNTVAGLGNLHYDCVHNCLYVSDEDDGKIYRLSPTGTTLSTWDHGANLASASPPSPAILDDPSQQFTQLGRRVWAVQAHGGRLYYSVWWEDMGRPDPVHANQIWSVALQPNGDFIPGTCKLEITMPPVSGQNWSNPVSDICFGPAGQMMLAERSMADDTSPSAHQSRALEYVLSAGVWVPSPNTFTISQLSTPGSSAGGCAYDFGASSTCPRVWVTGDALHLNVNDFIYGLQGLPYSGGSIANSILIDLDGQILQQNKTEIGDVAIPCPPSNVEVVPNFTATTVCFGQATTFTDTSTGAVTWAWNFGDPASGPNNTSTLQNPTHTFTAAGTYTVTLCINGGPCISHNVIVNPAPPVPTITGPASTCTSPAVYCVSSPAPGVVYTWTVSGGSISGPNTGTCVTINWTGSGPGLITVTAVDPKTQCTSVRKLEVTDCGTWLDKCCDGVKLDALFQSFVKFSGGIYTLTPTLSAGPGNVIRVVADVISASRTFTPAGCGTSGPVNSIITSVTPVAGFTSTFPVPNSHMVIWHSINPSGVNMGAGVNFPINIQFPLPPSGLCRDQLSFCVRYTFTTVTVDATGQQQCQTCEIIRCYGPFNRGGKIIWDTQPTGAIAGLPFLNQPVVRVVDDDGNPVPDATGNIAVSIKPGTGADGATLGGKTTMPVGSDGSAAFSDLSIDKPGLGYQLTARWDQDPYAEDVASAPFNVSLTGRIPIVRAATPIQVDGKIDQNEWSGAPVIPLGAAAQDLLPGNWKGASDYSASVQLKWDDTYLYLAAQVTDDVVSFPDTPEQQLGQRDGMELFLGTRKPQNAGRTVYDNPGDYDVVLSADAVPGALPIGHWFSPQSTVFTGQTDNVRLAPSSNGYMLEARLPWSALGKGCCGDEPAAGDILGFDLQGRDNDQTTPATDSLMSLTGLPNADTNPQAWTSAVLLAGGLLRGDINMDGVVNADDVTLAMRIAAGSTDAASAAVSFPNGDVNKDGKLDMADAVRINRIVNGL